MKKIILSTLLSTLALSSYALEDGDYQCFELDRPKASDVFLQIEVKDERMYRVNFMKKEYLPKGDRGEMYYQGGKLVWEDLDSRISFSSPRLQENRFGVVFSSSFWSVSVPGAGFDVNEKSLICEMK